MRSAIKQASIAFLVAAMAVLAGWAINESQAATPPTPMAKVQKRLGTQASRIENLENRVTALLAANRSGGGAVGADGPRGPRGFTGAKGDDGARGAVGATGLQGVAGPPTPLSMYQVFADEVTVPAGQDGSAFAKCWANSDPPAPGDIPGDPPDDIITGGFDVYDEAAGGVFVRANGPLLAEHPGRGGSNDVWITTIYNSTSSPVRLKVHAVCVRR